MSREDYISKLFVDNEHKLEQAPENDLWSRIESKLEQQAPTASTEEQAISSATRQSGRQRSSPILKLAPYMAAASVLLVIITVFAFFGPGFNNQDAIAESQTTAAKEEAQPIVEVILPEETDEIPINKTEAESQVKSQDKLQEKDIKELAEELNPQSNKPVSIEDVEIKDNSSNTEIELIAEVAAVKADEEKTKARLLQKAFPQPSEPNFNYAAGNNAGYVEVEKKLDDYKYVPKDDVFDQYKGQNYGVPPSAEFGDISENEITEAQNRSSKKDRKAKKRNNSYSDSPIRSRANKADRKISKPEQLLHPRLKMFDWMLGKWTDTELEGGVSYETWTWLNPNTIKGTGVKLKEGTELFKEQMLLYYDPNLNQVFLKMQISDDASRQAIFMLSSWDTDRIIFNQKDNNIDPTKVIFQRSMNGYQVIIDHERGFLKTDQQSYLTHRNRVSNVRAIRNLELVEE